MRISRKLTVIPALAALFCLTAAALQAEMLYQRVPRGNNVGLGIGRLGGGGWAGPWYTSANNTVQFPAGSGNLVYADCGLVTYMVTRDSTENDVTANDTIMPPDGGPGPVFLNASIYNYDDVMAIANSQPNLGMLGQIPYDRVWSSLDAEELADWPTAGRYGRSPNGEPMLHGAETMMVHYGDLTNTYGYGAPAGMYCGYMFYFLDYGESANMVYVNMHWQNVSEFLKYNAVANYNRLGKKHPDGYTFQGAIFIPFWRQVGFGANSNNSGWAWHPAKEIVGYWSKSPTISSYKPNEPFIFGYKVLKTPSLKGETATLQNIHTDNGSTEFGVRTSWALVRSNFGSKDRYKYCMGADPKQFTADRINPFTGRQLIYWPGIILPTDQRYNQWLWGIGGGSLQASLCPIYGEVHDMAPRDTVSMDMVIMFTYPGVSPLIAPTVDIANIDAPVMQDAMAPLAHYADVAQIVYDGGYILPATPNAPPLTIIPGDRQVTLTWSDVNLRTPDPYYAFVQEKGLDPNGIYREYDFEGYRVYRNFVGPNNEHAELIFDCSLTANNIQFYYIDDYDNDRPYYRMRNGLRAWYSLVPYDRNFDVATATQFSLPALESSKTWNRPGETGLYTVVPRSEASNFKAAGVEGEIVFQPAAGSPVFEQSYPLAADSASGTLIDAPVYLAPSGEFQFTPVIAEKITAARSFSVQAQGFKVFTTGENYGARSFVFTDGSHTQTSPDFTVRRRNQASLASMLFQGPVDSDGALYSLKADFQYMSDGDYRTRLLKTVNLGSHATAGDTLRIYASGQTAVDRLGGYAPAHPGQIRAGRFTLTWQSTASGLTLQVMDVTRNKALDFTEIPDNYGWGFVTRNNFTTMWSGRGTLYDNMVNNVPVADRTVKMVSSIAADNTAEYGIWINGLLWSVRGGGTVTMPAAGTVFTIDNAWGVWSSNRKTFTQQPDSPFPGDKWNISISPTTVNPEDADFSKIRVVPNPYVASSFLDMTANDKRIEFVNLPAKCTIRIYSLGGNLVNVLNHIGINRYGWGDYTDWDRLSLSQPNEYTGYDNHGGTEPWNMRNRFGQTVASGLYFFHVTDERGKTHTGKFYIIN